MTQLDFYTFFRKLLKQISFLYFPDRGCDPDKLLTKEPLCAAYVKYNYGGESAHQNPLFMKTNYILAAAWGLLYVLTAVWTFLLRRAGFGNLLIIVNNLIPILMVFFTMWFEKWYPAKMARGKRQEENSVP